MANPRVDDEVKKSGGPIAKTGQHRGKTKKPKADYLTDRLSFRGTRWSFGIFTLSIFGKAGG